MQKTFLRDPFEREINTKKETKENDHEPLN